MINFKSLISSGLFRSMHLSKTKALFFSLLSISLCFFFFYFRERLFVSKSSLSKTLPDFSCQTISKNTISSSTIKRKLVYIQFIEGKSLDSIELLNHVYKEFLKPGTFYNIIFIDNPNYFFRRCNINLKDLNFVISNFNYYKSLFKLPRCCNLFLIYNKNKLVFSGTEMLDYENIIRPFLLSQVNSYRPTFDIINFAAEGNILSDKPWLLPLNDIIKYNNKTSYLFSFHNDICMSCLSGAILRLFDLIINKYGEKVLIISFIYGQHRQTDIINIKSQLETNINIEAAPREIELKLDELGKIYGKANITDIIIFVDRMGRIIKSWRVAPHQLEAIYKYITRRLK